MITESWNNISPNGLSNMTGERVMEGFVAVWMSSQVAEDIRDSAKLKKIDVMRHAQNLVMSTVGTHVDVPRGNRRGVGRGTNVKVLLSRSQKEAFEYEAKRKKVSLGKLLRHRLEYALVESIKSGDASVNELILAEIIDVLVRHGVIRPGNLITG